jgi:hypothetical protein
MVPESLIRGIAIHLTCEIDHFSTGESRQLQYQSNECKSVKSLPSQRAGENTISQFLLKFKLPSGQAFPFFTEPDVDLTY